MDRISSRQNAVVKRFREVAGDGPAGEWMLLDGEHLVTEAVAAGLDVDVLAMTERLLDGRLASLAADLEHRGTRVVIVTDQVLGAISPVKEPSGLAALAARPATSLARALDGERPLVLILNEIQDPGNVGAIVRAAEGCGATGVIATAGGADPFGWKALRGAMGSTFRLPIASGHPLDAVLTAARTAGLRVIATTAARGTPLPACDLRAGCAILLGAEGPGLPAHVVDAADERLTIPMRPPVESLNVAVTAALILYEAARQRTSITHRARGTNVTV
ncbi:MAG: methyltransferase, TrmH family [Acidobacteriota bacterium]|jgi:TrmH family RNA methyltransferase